MNNVTGYCDACGCLSCACAEYAKASAALNEPVRKAVEDHYRSVVRASFERGEMTTRLGNWSGCE